jgi:hypothetical protein
MVSSRPELAPGTICVHCNACDILVDVRKTKEMVFGILPDGRPDPTRSEHVCADCMEWFILTTAWIPGERDVNWEKWDTNVHGKVSRSH